MGLLDKLRAKADDQTAPAPGGTVKDPVCGMRIKPERAAGHTQLGQQTTYFCSLNCKHRFDADPAKYQSA